ncbi:general secretion pathway protein GspK [Dickeya dianthicola]|uniref:type II secretion system minor pseudopilin GspK n=1 Tax=Dickeya dianthicola TaxID=204039 RepID=UPI0003A9675B|nr:type II secretion system minor pseudopilin GspK [Dickeya dianthicola]ATO33971.1 General secretion pathway protein K [Dickeya dianthicola RNS04.9]MCA7003668.1 type II secretion system minor pseudopilin GspK [Dickeya dianthicola]MCI4029926.1 type II secretion system minor pseudopilin GspK [Dickeya dianthicola]MCI4152663.1 type II secretion system minor pseudopilin GspK [Dickeya dianthicola]MCI4174113.1 type II secretion system minor pseudopilin GspK [Dickeya dianthicola]
MSRRQRGVALLIVMLMLALMVTIAATITERSGKAWQRTSNLLNRTQARWYALGAEALISSVLQRDAQASPESTFVGQPWSKVDHQMMADGSEIRAQVMDGQACLNLNALSPAKTPAPNTASGNNSTNGSSGNSSTPPKVGTAEQVPYAAQVFRQLLIVQGEDPKQAERITDAVRDWLDEDSEPLMNGAEDDSYVNFHPGNQRMTDVTELRAVIGVDAALYRRLLPYVCVLPVDKLVLNVNTLTPESAPLLSALFMGEMSTEMAERVLQQRPPQGWRNLNDFMGLSALPENAKTGIRQVLAIKSDWFFADIQIRVDDSEFYQRSLFHRGKQIEVVQRQYGGYRTVNP